MSLLGSIFGGSSADEGSKEKGGGLFDASSSLPAPPQHTVFPARRKRQETTSEDSKKAPEEGESSRERKKRKREKKSNDETPSDRDSEKKSDAADAETENTTNRRDDQSKDNDAEDRIVFVGNLPLDTTRKSLASLFKSCGKVESTRLRSVAAAGVKLPPERAGDQNLMKKVCANTNKIDSDAKSTAQGYVVFASAESVEKALKLNNTLVQSMRIRVDHASPTMDASRSVFVGNLPYHANEESLKTHFEDLCGNDTVVEGVRIVRDKDTMQCKGFGYVLFQDKAMVATALQKTPNSSYLKRNLRVQVCGKRTKNKKGKNDAQSKRRNFEGNRSTVPSRNGGQKTANKRARGEKKNSSNLPHKKAGVSKRAAAQAKEGKRVKQIQKRIAKGMGKARR